jgi:hypothetical protein
MKFIHNDNYVRDHERKAKFDLCIGIVWLASANPLSNRDGKIKQHL